MVRRAIRYLTLGFLAASLLGLAREALGLNRCECYADCWCKKMPLHLFRWTVPRWHHGPWSDEEAEMPAQP